MASSTGQPGAVSPQTYWKRRALVLAFFMLVVAIIAYACSPVGDENGDPVRGDAGGGEPDATPSAAPEEPTEAETDEAEEEDEEPTEEPSDGVEDEDGGGDSGGGGGDSADFPAPERPEDPCHPDDVRVTLEFEEEKGEEQTYPAGVDPSFRIMVIQLGDQTCTVDVGPEALELQITSGDHTWFSSAHCQEGNTQEERQLDRGGHHDYLVTWDRVRTFDDCRSTNETAGEGTYHVELNGDHAGDVDRQRFLLDG